MWGCRWRENKWGASPFFLCKTGVDERDGVDKKKPQKMTQEGGCAANELISLTQILLCTFSLTQSFLRGFS